MTENQWKNVVERLHKYRVIKMPDGDLLILWENGDVSLCDGSDGHCIICANTVDKIRTFYVD